MQYNIGDVSFNTFQPLTVVFVARPPDDLTSHWKVYAPAIGKSPKCATESGVSGGADSHQMTIDEMPQHTHPIYSPAYGLTNTLAEAIETFARRKSTQTTHITALPSNSQTALDMTPPNVGLIPIIYGEP